MALLSRFHQLKACLPIFETNNQDGDEQIGMIKP